MSVVSQPESRAGGRPTSLSAPYEVEFPFERTTGPVMGAFLSALREGRLLGIRTGAGEILCPPPEFDPASGAHHDDPAALVELEPAGTVTSWTWVPSRPGDPVPDGFAWALIRIDGTTGGTLMHAVDTGGDPDLMQVGLRVSARWTAARAGALSDIGFFAPGEPVAAPPPTDLAEGHEGAARLVTPLAMHYTYVPGASRSAFLRGLADRRIIGRTCPSCEQTYVPAPDFCARCLCELGEEQQLDGRGTVVTYCVVSFPFPGQTFTPPYAVAHIRLTGADTRVMHLIQEVELSDIELGMEVEPVWETDQDPEPGWTNIRYFRPTTTPEATRA